MPEEYNPVRRPRLLLIDDDVEFCELLRQFLHKEGFDISASHTGEHGVGRLESESFDLVLLDIMLPGINGLESLRRIRAQSSVPVLMLTAKGEDIDRIVGLELGADDYLPKPCNTRELLARIHAVLRRTRGAPPGRGEPARLSVGDVELDMGARVVRRDGQVVELTGVEFDLLALLLREAGQVVSRERLFKEVLGRAAWPDDRSLDMHISNLRKKLGHKIGGGKATEATEATEATTERIKTVRGHGYVYARISA
jgi:two-component system, OmpR family, response regulator CpxR